jgi:hypothetical protein
MRLLLPLCHDSICYQTIYILTQHTSNKIVAHTCRNIAWDRQLLRCQFYRCDCHCRCGIISFAFKGLTSMDLTDLHLPLLLLSYHTRFSLITISGRTQGLNAIPAHVQWDLKKICMCHDIVQKWSRQTCMKLGTNDRTYLHSNLVQSCQNRAGGFLTLRQTHSSSHDEITKPMPPCLQFNVHVSFRIFSTYTCHFVYSHFVYSF